jgi:hypothetical protein
MFVVLLVATVITIMMFVITITVGSPVFTVTVVIAATAIWTAN